MQFQKVDPRHLLLKHPFPAIISGPTHSGKSVLIRRIVEYYPEISNILNNKVRVLWVFGEHLKMFDIPLRNPNIEVRYIDFLPSNDQLRQEKPDLLIIDDLMTELGGDKELANIFTKLSHHNDMSVIFVVQNLFNKGSFMRTISLNAHYIFLMKNVRDQSQIANLGRQIYPRESESFLESYDDATEKPFGYLLVDLTQTTPRELRLRSKITPPEFPIVVYIPKKKNGLRKSKGLFQRT